MEEISPPMLASYCFGRRRGSLAYVGGLLRRCLIAAINLALGPKRSRLLRCAAFPTPGGYKDGNDLNRLRHDPLMKIAVERCPESADPLASQSTISRLENAPRK